ncbi:MAG TPA: glycoside hydrolase family 2 [Rhodanobacteraceae bacterium]|nr:glycoside hydrolase family 2 [Rhodanobacteraceae bacterium]
MISSQNFTAKGWYPVKPRSTVFAGLIQNGRFSGVFTGDKLRRVNFEHFDIPWWYRTTFRLSDADKLHTFIVIKGIIPGADVWLNGVRLASRDEIAGAYAVHSLDAGKYVHNGTNVLAIKVYPANPNRDLSLSWIDWNPAPPDHNMGIWRDVDIVRSGPVSLHDVYVTADLSVPALDRATLTIHAKLRNDTDVAQTAVLGGNVAGVQLGRSIRLDPHQTRAVTFDRKADPALAIDHPRVWWPAGMGGQPLYHLRLAVKTQDDLSDRANVAFGIRSVTSHLTRQGYRQFVINGMPLLIRGGGWAPDMFLRDDPRRLAQAFRYMLNLGLNTIRLEGKLERQDFFERADRDGILVLAGWECCSKWEAGSGTGGEPWDARDHGIAEASMSSEARLLRDHPSVIAFLIGSDNAPPPEVAASYVDALESAGWPDPIIAAASDATTKPIGPSGMKMSGPYAWVPPDYWYGHKAGAAFGFNSEASAGIDIPNLESVKSMLTASARTALWQDYGAHQFHSTPGWSRLSTLGRFDTALAHRYGKPENLADYVAKAQLANYANARAQFEAYDARMDAPDPATGIIYWMLNSAWPSLHWHLFTYGLEPAGAYYGAQKANEPLHIQYDPVDRAVLLVNHTRHNVADLTARIRIRGLDGRVLYEHAVTRASIEANHAATLLTIPAPKNPSSTWFVELTLARDGHDVSRNVYWLPDRPDELEWDKSDGYTTPVSRYADLSALQSLPSVAVRAKVSTHRDGDTAVTTVALSNPGNSAAMALFIHLSIRHGADGKAILPVYWSSNDVTLWPGESMQLTARYPVATGQQTRPMVRVSGWNVATRSLDANVEH